jgi:molybdenum cofactor cytidylyltransferase
MTDVALVLMAAGNARRMGGGNKLLMPWRGAPLVAHAAKAARQALRFNHRLLVTGRDGDAVADEAGHGLVRIHNERHADGFGTSLAAAMRHMLTHAPDAQAALIALADMPLVTAGDFDALVSAWAELPAPAIVRASSSGAPGNPVILPRLLFDVIATLDGDDGAKGLIARAGLATHLVEIGTQALIDFDTPEAFAAHP